MRTTKRERLAAIARENQRFLDERGNSLSGYIQFYERFGRTPEYAQRLWEADSAWQRDLEAKLAKCR